jgi:uncharacterized membrane protein
MRTKDIVLLAGAIIGLLLGLGKVFILADAVERNVKMLEIVEPRLDNHETRLSVNDERWGKIQEDIKFIKMQLNRNRRNGN